jgi:hypothetical protein
MTIMQSMRQECVLAPEPGHGVPSRYPGWVTWLAFAVGLTGAISLRLILIAKACRPELVRLLWYLGVCGNMLFFMFRAFITHRRRRLITTLRLQEKLHEENSLCPEDYEALRYLVGSLYASKERWNYLVIFIFSIMAIAWDIVVEGF